MRPFPVEMKPESLPFGTRIIVEAEKQTISMHVSLFTSIMVITFDPVPWKKFLKQKHGRDIA